MNVHGVVLFSLVSVSVFAADCWWIGNNASDPMVANNWYGVPTEVDRICVNDGPTHPMTISAGTALVCKHFTLGANKSLMDNAVTMNGGTLETKGDFSIGNCQGSGGTFTLNGGTISVANVLYVGQGANSGGLFKMTGGTLGIGGDIILNAVSSATGTFEMTCGTINMKSAKSFAVPRRGVASASVSGSTAVINFNGAYLYLAAGYSWDGMTSGRGTFTLADGATLNGMGYIEVDGPESAFICNGGVLVCAKAGNLFTGKGSLYVGNGGITVDTQGFAVSLNKPMLAADGATAGGLVKKGTGTLTLSRGNTYLPGPVDIQAGKVIARAPNALPGSATYDFKLAVDAELELGGAWSVEQVAAIKALPTVLGTVTHNRAIDEDATIVDDLTPADVSADGKLVNPMTGGAMLTLTGHNDLGGEFRVNSGVLAADFGQGLATTDHLTLGADNGFNNYTPGLFAPLSGLVTCNLGAGGGEISFGTNGTYYHTEAGFAGVVPTTVRLFNDATRVLKVNQELPRKLVFNTTAVTNTVHFENPIDLNGSPANIDITVQGGEAYLDGGIDGLVNGTPSTSVGAMAKKGSGTLHMPATSKFHYVYSQGGLLAFPAGSYEFWRIQTNGKGAQTEFAAGAKVTLDNLMTSTAGSLIVNEGCEVTTSAAGTFSSSSAAVFSNAAWTVTGGDVVLNRDSTSADYPNGGSVLIKGGTFKNTGTGWMQVQEAGELVFDGCTAEIKPQVNAGRSSAANHPSSKVIIRNGAQMTMANLVAMSGDVEISGDDTSIKLAGLWQGESDTASSASGPGKILVKGGRIEASGDVRVGYCSGSVGLLRFEGGSIKLASAKSLAVGSAGNGTLEVAGGLVDVSGADGVAVLPTWKAEEATYKKTPGGLIRFLGGEVKARKIYGNATRGKADIDIDGGKVTFVNASSTTLFSGMTSRRVGVNGGEIDSGTVNVTMGGALTALTNQTKVVATGAALNTAKALAKSGSSTLTLVGANTYACGTEVKAGTLVLQSGASLSNDQFVRLSGGTLDLGGTRQTVSAVLGTGTVKSGSLTVTEAIYPAGVGTVGTLTFTDVVPTGRVVIDVDAQTGACDKLVVNGTLDASKLEFEIADVTALEKTKLIRVCEATAITGRPTITNLPGNYSLATGPTSISIARGGLVFYVR